MAPSSGPHPLAVATAGSLHLGCLDGGGGFVPFLPSSAPPQTSLAHCGHSRGFVPLGKYVYFDVVDALRQLNPPLPLPGFPPWGFPPLHRPCGLLRLPSLRRARLPVCRPHSPPPSPSYSVGLAGRVFPPARKPLPCRSFCPMAASRSCLVGSRRGGFAGVAPSGRCARWPTVRASFAVSSLPASPTPIAVTSSSFNAKSFVSSPLHSAHSSLLSSV